MHLLSLITILSARNNVSILYSIDETSLNMLVLVHAPNETTTRFLSGRCCAPVNVIVFATNDERDLANVSQPRKVASGRSSSDLRQPIERSRLSVFASRPRNFRINIREFIYSALGVVARGKTREGTPRRGWKVRRWKQSTPRVLGAAPGGTALSTLAGEFQFWALSI